MPRRARAIVECLDPRALETLSRLGLPTFDGWLDWYVTAPASRSSLASAEIVFVIAHSVSRRRVGARVRRYRNAGRFALGASARNEKPAVRCPEGVAILDAAAWEDSVRMLLCSVASLLGEGQPEVFVCVDWGDARDALEAPGELLFEWKLGDNASACRAAFARIAERLGGGRSLATLCLLSGGTHLRLKELRAASAAGRQLSDEDAIVLVGDALAPFGGKPGCCVFAVAAGGIARARENGGQGAPLDRSLGGGGAAPEACQARRSSHARKPGDRACRQPAGCARSCTWSYTWQPIFPSTPNCSSAP